MPREPTPRFGSVLLNNSACEAPGPGSILLPARPGRTVRASVKAGRGLPRPRTEPRPALREGCRPAGPGFTADPQPRSRPPARRPLPCCRCLRGSDSARLEPGSRVEAAVFWPVRARPAGRERRRRGARRPRPPCRRDTPHGSRKCGCSGRSPCWRQRPRTLAGSRDPVSKAAPPGASGAAACAVSSPPGRAAAAASAGLPSGSAAAPLSRCGRGGGGGRRRRGEGAMGRAAHRGRPLRTCPSRGPPAVSSHRRARLCAALPRFREILRSPARAPTSPRRASDAALAVRRRDPPGECAPGYAPLRPRRRCGPGASRGSGLVSPPAAPRINALGPRAGGGKLERLTVQAGGIRRDSKAVSTPGGTEGRGPEAAPSRSAEAAALAQELRAARLRLSSGSVFRAGSCRQHAAPSPQR